MTIWTRANCTLSYATVSLGLFLVAVLDVYLFIDPSRAEWWRDYVVVGVLALLSWLASLFGSIRAIGAILSRTDSPVAIAGLLLNGGICVFLLFLVFLGLLVAGHGMF